MRGHRHRVQRERHAHLRVHQELAEAGGVLRSQRGQAQEHHPQAQVGRLAHPRCELAGTLHTDSFTFAHMYIGLLT